MLVLDQKVLYIFSSLWKAPAERINRINHATILCRWLGECMCVTRTRFIDFFFLHPNYSYALKTCIQIQHVCLSHASPDKSSQADTAWWLIAVGHQLLKAEYKKHAWIAPQPSLLVHRTLFTEDSIELFHIFYYNTTTYIIGKTHITPYRLYL